MTISVIIPTFNNEDTLEATIRSVLAQDHEDFEIAVVNDGGRSPKKFLDVSDPRLKLIEAPRNGGVSTARNLGFQESSGELVYFLDSDDLVAPGMLGYAHSVFADPTVQVLSVGHETLSDDEIRQGRASLPVQNPSTPRRLTPPEFFRLIQARTNLFLPSTTIVRRKALVDTLGPTPWNTELRIAQDTLLMMQVGWKNDIHVTEGKYVIYRRRPGSLTRNEKAMWRERAQAMDMLGALLKQGGAGTELIEVTLQMRQNAARRVARLLRDEGAHRDARTVLAADMANSFNWKSAVEYMRSLRPS
ncbi:glycosyltransferase family 2 protein [Rubellimicrobium arenae]|uniref:glycosyltransferase family 2 protein n=1 Tax=Rubellimicrobium arenae TaxID=2817372 RepID=UPI001B30EACE|nr:glycosyltransferase family 2 protein [Rubellimicrobium arenae]